MSYRSISKSGISNLMCSKVGLDVKDSMNVCVKWKLFIYDSPSRIRTGVLIYRKCNHIVQLLNEEYILSILKFWIALKGREPLKEIYNLGNSIENDKSENSN